MSFTTAISVMEGHVAESEYAFDVPLDPTVTLHRRAVMCSCGTECEGAGVLDARRVFIVHLTEATLRCLVDNCPADRATDGDLVYSLCPTHEMEYGQ